MLFSPDKGGILIASDGRRLAGAPARVPGREFVLPNAAVQVLGHPDFNARDAAILQPEAGESPHVQFRSGPHTLIARTIEGNYCLIMPCRFTEEAADGAETKMEAVAPGGNAPIPVPAIAA